MLFEAATASRHRRRRSHPRASNRTRAPAPGPSTPAPASTTHPLLRWVASSGAIHPCLCSYHRLMAADQDPNLPSASRPTRPAGLVPNAAVAAVAAYTGIRTRVGDLVRDLAPGVADETRVPACPEWSVTETLAHLVGVTVDIVEGNIAEAGTKPWADAQAARFSSLGVMVALRRAETAPVHRLARAGGGARHGGVAVGVRCRHPRSTASAAPSACPAPALPMPSRWASGSSWPHWPVVWRADRLPRWSSR